MIHAHNGMIVCDGCPERIYDPEGVRYGRELGWKINTRTGAAHCPACKAPPDHPHDARPVKIEYTDTFGGEANYSWVKRAELGVTMGATDAQVKRLAKQEMGIAGVRGTWEESGGDLLTFRPRGVNTVLFVTFE